MGLFNYQHHKPIQLRCSIDLNELLPTENERNKFYTKWDAFLTSDPNNSDIYDLNDNQLTYISEQIVPTKEDNRPPLLLVLGNPASHSVKSGMFFSFEGNGKEHRFWKSILKPSGILDLSFDSDQSVEKLNEQRRDALINLDYKSSFRIGLCVFISMPSAPAGKWGGIAGVQKLIGVRALRRLEQAETERVLECVRKFVSSDGAVVTFQKNAWNGLKSVTSPEYTIVAAKNGKLKGHLKDIPDIPLYSVPPTRLVGPTQKVLKQLLFEKD